MNNLRRLCTATILMIIIALTAFADDGKVGFPGITSQPPPQTTIETTATDGKVDCPGITGQIDCGATEAITGVIDSLLALS